MALYLKQEKEKADKKADQPIVKDTSIGKDITHAVAMNLAVSVLMTLVPGT